MLKLGAGWTTPMTSIKTLLYSSVGSAFQVNPALRFKHSLSIYGGGEGEKIGESRFCCLGPRIAPPCLIRERNAFKQLALVACVYASHVSRTTFFLRHPWLHVLRKHLER